MSWTTPADLRAQVKKLWDKGQLLACLIDDEGLFPLRLILKYPGSAELSEHFDAVRIWIADLQHGAKHGARPGYRLVQREVRHRVIGTNALPHEAWIDTLDDALALIGMRREAEQFRALAALTGANQPALLPWLKKRPLRALELAGDWPRLLDIVGWLQANPRPGIYLRQVDLPGMHSKFIEAYRASLSEMLDLALPAEAIDTSVNGAANFARRYGFRDKPVRLRFRLLDPQRALLATGSEQDFTVTHDTFARLDPDASRIFITENEINFLAFPPMADSLVIFGAGYGFDMLAEAAWLHRRAIYYWGDIDTHGFAILDQLRMLFPHVRSFLMDRDTLLAHRQQWIIEPQPTLRDLPRLDDVERMLFDDLRDNRLGRHIRLEQERLRFGWIEEALAGLWQG
ncbi:Wadjet anti-phage system protein JetD domain-containing protein [Noviherbaspirillum saxi]|uniref:Wadjet protein JetD C-terminal domain-containing protein n=1 Tax=Noviherbaspirillum saxi TaxID=2320863 RepID=A0A3A3FR02_9BURK|nr:Wadjet anti-phage system protein JetD domain-containing protein [Noviherbaspirillum saxi]RJF97644.1 hypothetical protein D3871_03235 [Noviherbaspirillum saxi]